MLHPRTPSLSLARTYSPLPVTLASGQGAWVTDVDGRRYLDCLAGYSALNFGHRHPALVAAAHRQLDRLTLTSRAFGNDRIGPFCAALAELLGKQMVLPMNTGAEAVVVERPAGEREPVQLRLGGGDERRVAVAEVERRVRAQAVEVAAALDVVHPASLAALDDHRQRVVVVRAVALLEGDQVVRAVAVDRDGGHGVRGCAARTRRRAGRPPARRCGCAGRGSG